MQETNLNCPIGSGSVGSSLGLRVACCHGNSNNARTMQGLAAVGGSGPGFHSRCRLFSPVTLVFMPAVRATKAFCLLGLLWKDKWAKKIWASAWCGWRDAPAVVKSGEQRGRHRKGGWGVNFIRLRFAPALDSKPGQRSPASAHYYLKPQPPLVSSLCSVHSFHYVLLFGMNKTRSFALCFFGFRVLLRCALGELQTSEQISQLFHSSPGHVPLSKGKSLES